MITVENECVDCGLPCVTFACPYYRVTRYICDRCGAEDATLYEYDGEELCAECILEELNVVEGSEC